MSSTRKHPKYENITSKWGGMKIRKEFSTRIDKWLQAFGEEEKAFMLELLAKFYYYSEENVNKKVVELHNEFLKIYNGNEDDVVYTKIIKENGVAFSDILFSKFWMKNSIGYNVSQNNILNLLECGQAPKKLAIVDDYSGTGETLIKTINKMIETNEVIRKSNIYFLTLQITMSAVQNITEYAKNKNINIHIVSLDYTKKAFDCNYIYDEMESEYKKNYYLEICKKQNIDKLQLGYGEIASLISFYYNTPNNTLGIFWKDLIENIALFPRKKKRKTTLNCMKQRAKQRKNRDYKPVVFGIDDSKMAVMVTYCIVQKEGVSIEAFMDTFGVTIDQADEILKNMIVQGFVINVNGKFVPAMGLKDNIFMSRINNGQHIFDDHVEKKEDFQEHENYIPCNF